MMDFTKTDDISRHRYRFWFLFPWGDNIENTLAVPGHIPAEEADTLARAAWAMSLHDMVGSALPVDRGRHFAESMAAEAATRGSFVVMRPGSMIEIGGGDAPPVHW